MVSSTVLTNVILYKMKGFASIVFLMISVFMVFPIVILIFEHIISGRDSIIQKMLNNIES